MVLNEDALEAMIRRQNEAAANQKAGGSELAEQTDEFEVYERPKVEEPEPEEVEAQVDAMPEPVAATQEFEEYPAPTPEPAPEPEPMPVEEIPSFRESFQAEHVPTHAPAPQIQETVRREFTTAPSIAVVQARFNQEITGPMAELAVKTIQDGGAELHSHKTVAGVYDLPLMAQALARRHDVDAVVVLGVVVQGSTKHDEIITHCTAKTLQEISLQTMKPIGLGITGPGMTWEQAEARIGNAGHAVEAVLELLENL